MSHDHEPFKCACETGYREVIRGTLHAVRMPSRAGIEKTLTKLPPKLAEETKAMMNAAYAKVGEGGIGGLVVKMEPCGEMMMGLDQFPRDAAWIEKHDGKRVEITITQLPKQPGDPSIDIAVLE